MVHIVAQTIIEALQEVGTRRCNGVPGDTLNHFTDVISRSAMRFVHMRNEEAGAFAAGADAFLTDELAVCAGSCGPGSLHFINGLYEANRSRSPGVLLATQIEWVELGFDFPQEVDFKAVYASGTVFCEEVRTAESAQRLTVMAAQQALTKRGVAVLIVPSDVAGATAPPPEAFRVHRPKSGTVPGQADLQRVAAALQHNGRITIYCGSGCKDAHRQVMLLGGRPSAPVAHTSRAKDFSEPEKPSTSA